MDANSSGKLRRRRLSLRDILVLVLVVCLLVSLAIRAVLSAREAARRAHCATNLLQIGMGLQNYDYTYHSFPPAFIADQEGRPRHSWRLLTLPYWTCDPFYDMYDFDEPWNGPSNLKVAAEHGQIRYLLHCPSDPSLEEMTSYPAVVGTATAWPGPEPSHLQDFSKGMSHSIQVVEQTHSGIEWLEPRDLQFDHLELTIHSPSRNGVSIPPPVSGQAISSQHPKGANVLFADASVEFLAADTSPELIEEMLVIGGSEPKIPLGPRKRLRFGLDPDSTDQGPKKWPYRLESYTLDETREPGQ